MEDLVSELVKSIKSAKTAPEQVDVPLFKPETTDAKKWLTELADIKSELSWTDEEILTRVGRFLSEVSKTWFDVWSPDNRNWESFGRDFTEAFPPRRNLGRLLSEAAEFNSDSCNTYDAYVFQKTSMLKSLRANWSEADLVELVLHGIKEPDVRTTANNHNLKKIADLLVFLGTLTKLGIEVDKCERPTTSKSTIVEEPPRKRFREDRYKQHYENQPHIKRHRCGKYGHIQRHCSSETDSPAYEKKTNNHPSSSLSSNTNTNQTVYSFCAKNGHSADNCFIMQEIRKHKKIIFFTTGKDLNREEFHIDDLKFYGILDTGAGISLTAERYANHFESKLEFCELEVSGTLAGTIPVKQRCQAILKISYVITVIHVVPNKILEYDVIIGCNLYDHPEISTMTDQNGTRAMRAKMAKVFRIVPSLTNEPTDVPEQQQKALIDLLSRFPKLVHVDGTLPQVNNATLQITLKDDFVVNRNPYRLSISEIEAVRGIIKELLENGILQESESAFASPTILVRKKEGSYLMCVDYRELNSYTTKDKFPLPLIHDQFNRLGKRRYFTSLDMSFGFHQIPMENDSIEKTVLVTPDGHNEFLRMSFGLANAPAVFQRATNKTLGKLRDNVALVHLDDILVPSESIEESINSLQLVFAALQGDGVSLNIFKEKLEYLGKEVSADGIRPGSRRIGDLVQSPTPLSVKQVWQYMGTLTAPITKLTRGGESFAWTNEQEEARKYVIEYLIKRLLSCVFDPTLPSEHHTDASSLGYGVILIRKKADKPRVVEYYNKRTTKYEENYHSYELETLTVVNALKHFRIYLIGIHFTLITDCSAIKFTSTKKDILPTVARWWSYMQDFNFTIVYRKGSSMPHVVLLSRNPVIRRINANYTWLYVEQRRNAEVNQLLNDANEGRLDNKQYLIKDGILHYLVKSEKGSSPKAFVPRHSRIGLLRIFHDEQCHIGPEKTTESLMRHFWFPNLRAFVKKYIKHCLVCAVEKTRTGPLQRMITNVETPEAPMKILHADCLGPLSKTSKGYKYILVLIDAFTKYCVLQPLKTVKAEEIQQAYQGFISLFGTPKQIVMDAETNFKNLRLPEYLDSLNIDYHYTTPDVHRSIGQVERYMRTIMHLLRIETTSKLEWPKSLWKVQLVLNITIQKSTQTTPLKALIGIDGSTPLIQSLLINLNTDLSPIRNLGFDRKRIGERQRQSNNTKIAANKKRRDDISFTKGDFVLMHRDEKMHQGKLNYEFQGPFEVMGITPDGHFELRRVGKSTITKAAKEQLRGWPNDWSLIMYMPDLLEMLENDLSNGNEKEEEELTAANSQTAKP